MERLRSQRLRLRPWTVSDAGFQRRLWEERDPRVPAHRRIDADGRPTLAEMEDWLRAYEPQPAPGLLVVELPTGVPIGSCGLIPHSVGRPAEPELAFEFSREHWGRGYATEASCVIVERARTLGYDGLVSTVREWNVASLGVLAKLGFVDSGERETDAAHGDSLLLRLRLRDA